MKLKFNVYYLKNYILNYKIIKAVERTNIKKAGRDLIKGSLILTWRPIAPTIKQPIKKAEISTTCGNQIPNSNRQAKDTFENPIIFINVSPNP